MLRRAAGLWHGILLSALGLPVFGLPPLTPMQDVRESAAAVQSLTPAERLHAAIRAGDLGQVQSLIASGVDANARDALGGTPLLTAVWAGNLEITTFLLQHGADVNARHPETGSTALLYSVLRSRADLAGALLKAGAKPDLRYRDQQTALHVAAERGAEGVASALISARADVNALDSNENTPLDAAVLHDRVPMVRLLLTHGADAQRVHSADGRGPLQEACIKGYSDIVPLLVEAGAGLTKTDRFGQTPLDLALAYKNGNVVAVLLRLGAHLEGSQSAAEQAMESATLHGQTEIAKILISSGFDINKPTSANSTYLNDAALKGQKKMVQLLLDSGASVDSHNQAGGTPLHDAALNGNAEVIRLLLDRGCKVDARDKEAGATPLMVAASLGRTDAVAELLSRGADPRLRDTSGRTALDRAKDTNDPATIKLLEEALTRSAEPTHGRSG